MLTTRQRYLQKRALSEPWRITGIKRSDYSTAIVIPACDEERWILRTLDSLAANRPDLLEQTLVLVVVNHPADIERKIKISNRRTLEQFTASPLRQKLQLGWIDACSDRFELSEGGVGSARKLGFDIALSRLRDDIDPVLISLDADTLVEPDYLEAIAQHFTVSSSGGGVIPFRHQPADTEQAQRAIDQYELYLHCYLAGLELAGSPYAYHSIGSAFACRASAYCRSGGMNRRAGGEDFYFLQALAKTGGVEQIRGTTVHPSARLSARVPFGTGPALINLIDNPASRIFYPLATFRRLGRWLQLAESATGSSGADLQHEASTIDPELGQFLHRLKLTDNWDRLRRNHPQQGLVRAFHTWFDALRSQQLLRFISRPETMLNGAEAAPTFLRELGLAPPAVPRECLELLYSRMRHGESDGI